jgi:hypothetical protein
MCSEPINVGTRRKSLEFRSKAQVINNSEG